MQWMVWEEGREEGTFSFGLCSLVLAGVRGLVEGKIYSQVDSCMDISTPTSALCTAVPVFAAPCEPMVDECVGKEEGEGRKEGVRREEREEW